MVIHLQMLVNAKVRIKKAQMQVVPRDHATMRVTASNPGLQAAHARRSRALLAFDSPRSTRTVGPPATVGGRVDSQDSHSHCVTRPMMLRNLQPCDKRREDREGGLPASGAQKQAQRGTPRSHRSVATGKQESARSWFSSPK